jgi:transglutaminase-like putative cysteine protease
MPLSNPESGNINDCCQSDATPIDHLLEETFYCDYSHPAIAELSGKIALETAK